MLDLAAAERTLVTDYSAGMRKKITLATALLHTPGLLGKLGPFKPLVMSCAYMTGRPPRGGFLLKDVEPDELVDAVRTVADGQGLVAPRVTRRLIAEFARSSPPLPAPPELGELTNRELAILGCSRAGCPTPRSVGSCSSARPRSSPCRQPARQARLPRPRPGGDLRLRARGRAPRRPRLTAGEAQPWPR